MPNPALTFMVSEKEYAEAMEFCKQHNELHGKSRAAMGGRFSWEFVSLTIGMVTQIRCSCGEVKSLTDILDM